ncbi:MAG TPA: SBBP repeat-containing protein, partial [Candidatus Binataceae bacterium]|nr:SBBP repeat-containing protein [Candidatus Binataceae bacterium]
DAVVASFDTTQTGASSLLFSEFIGGSGLDMATAVATQPGCPNNCFAYVAGYTFSADLPNVAIEEQPIQGFADAFAAKVDPHSGVAQVDTEGTESFDEALGIGVDSKGDAIIGGLTLDAGKLQTAVTDSLQPMPSPSGALYSSTDGGASFGAMSWPLVAGSISLNGLAVDFSVLGNSPPAPPAIYGGTNSQGLFWSIDGGAHFFQGAVQGISSASPKVSAVSIMNAGTATGPLPVLAAVDNQIEVSGNEGQTFEKRASMPVSGVNIYFIYSDLYSGSGGTSGNFNVMVGTDHGLFHSTDFGNSWLASTGLAGTGQVTQVFTGVRDEATGDYYVGTDKGVFKSTDNAATFTPTNMNFAPVLSLARTITATLQTGGDGNPGNPASPGGPPTPTGVPTPPSATGGGTGFTITTTIYAGTYGDGVVTSTDGFNQNFSYGAGLPSSTFNYVTTDRTSSTDLNAYVGVGNNLGIGSVWQTADGGATFTQLGGNSFGPPCCVFPVVVGAGQMYAGDYREADGLVYWLSPDFNNRTVSNLGGSSYDQINGVAVDSSNDAYVTGLTYSNNFPLLGPAQSSFGPGGNALVNGFVTKLGYDDDSAVIKAPFIMGFGKHRMRIRTKPQTIVVENKAKSTTVRLGYIHVAGGGANSFQIISGAPSYTGSGATGKPGKRGLQPCGALLAPHSKCGVTVVFTPLGAGRTIAAVLVPSDAKNGTQATELTGQGYQVSARHQNR